MATYKGIHVAFVADISDVGRKIRLIDSQAKDLDKTLAQVNKSLKLDPNNADLVAQKMRTIEEESDLLRRKLEQLNRIQREMATVDVASLDAKKAEAYRASLTRVNAEVAKTQAALKGLNTQSKELETAAAAKAVERAEAERRAAERVAQARERFAREEQARQEQLWQLKNSIYAAEQLAEEKREAERLAAIERENQARIASYNEVAAQAQTASQQITRGMSQLNSVISQVARALLLVETVLLRLGVSAVKTGAEFDASMSQLAATLDIEQVVHQQESAFVRLRNQALEYGKTTVYTATQAAEALNFLALGGLGVERSMEALPRVLTLAKAGSMELEKAANIVVASMSALNLETEGIDTLMDQMARTAQKSKVTVEQLGEATLKSASAFNLAGQDTATMNAILGVLGNRFENIADQANTLRTALNRVSTYADEIHKLGVEVEDGKGHVRNFIDIFADLNRALADKTDTERTSILTKIFGSRGFSYASYLMQATNGEIQALKKSIELADGAAEQMADTMTDNLQSDMIIVKSAAQDLAISITDRLNPALREAASSTTDMLNSMSEDVANGELGKDIEELGTNVRDLIERIVHSLAENGPAIVKIMGDLVENADKLIKLYMVFKGGTLLKTAASGILDITNGIKGTRAAFSQATALATQLSNTAGMTAAQVADLQVAQANATSAMSTGLLNVAGAATIAAAAIGTLAASFIDAKAAAIDVTNSEWEDKEVRKYLESLDEVQDKMRETRDNRENEISSIASQSEEYQRMAKRIEELADKEKLSVSQKQELYSLISQLNGAIPNLSLMYDENTSKLNMNNSALEEAITNYQDYLALIANQKYAEELSTQKVKYQIQLEEVQGKLPDAKTLVSARQSSLAQKLGLEWNASEQEIEELYSSMQGLKYSLFGDKDLSEIKEYYNRYKQAQDAVADLREEERKLKGAVENTDKSIAAVSTRVNLLTHDLGEDAIATANLSDAMKEQLEIAKGYYEENETDALAKQIEQYPELIELLEAAGYDMSAYKNKTEEAESQTQSFEERLKAAQSATSNYRSELKDLLGVLENVQKGTAYSTSQILDLIEKYPQLAGAIRETADGYIIEADAVRRLTEARAQTTVQAKQLEIAELESQLSKLMIKPADMDTDEWQKQRSALYSQYGEAQELLSAYRAIEQEIREGHIYFGSSSSGGGTSSYEGGGSSSPSGSSADPYEEELKRRKEAAKSEQAQLEHDYKMGLISAEDYYNGLMDVARRYYAGIGELREEYLSAESKVYEGLKKAQEDELSNAKKLEDQLRAVKEAEDALNNAQKQQVSVYSSAAGYHAEVNTAAIDKARQTLADKNYTLAETLLKNARYNGESLAERLQSIGLANIRDMLPDLSGLRLPSIGGGTTTNNNSTRNITYNGGDIHITIAGSVDETTLPKLKGTLEDTVRKVFEQVIDEENAARQTGGL